MKTFDMIKKVGFCGLGKLGLPIAVCLDEAGADVMGYDLEPSRMSKDPQPYLERGPDGTGNFNDHLVRSNVKFGSLQEVVDHAELIFVAVQTPHNPKFEGITELPEDRVDFDYSYLKEAIRQIAACATEDKIIAVICTCLPGTMEREIKPLFNEYMKLVYNPFFIAMGTTMHDFMNTEFVLLGVDDEDAAIRVEEFYRAHLSVPIKGMSVASAECVKVFYNTMITNKICIANAIGRMCHEVGAHADEVISALKSASDRIISTKYMDPGMGDGGGCHPRDNIALSFLARKHEWKYDPWNDLMSWREGYARWLADLLESEATKYMMPIVILGYAFKPETNLIVGSPAVLIASMLDRHCKMIDRHVEPTNCVRESEEPSVYLIGCKHPEYEYHKFPFGSIVIDPHRYIPDREGVRVIRIGE